MVNVLYEILLPKRFHGKRAIVLNKADRGINCLLCLSNFYEDGAKYLLIYFIIIIIIYSLFVGKLEEYS